MSSGTVNPSSMNDESSQQSERLEEYVASLINEVKLSEVKISALERAMGDAQRVAQSFHYDNEQFKAEIQRQQSEIESLANNVRSGQNRTTRVKPQKPEPFTGDRSEDVEGFLVTLERFLRLSSVPEESWVDYSASFLRKQADKCFRVQLSTYGTASLFATDFDVFKVEFVKQFKPMNALLTARDRVTKLRQTGSAIAYTHRFLELKLEIPDVSEAEAKDKYMRGLKPHVCQKVRVENPTTLNGMIRLAQQFDEAVYNTRQAVGKFHQTNSDAMELDVMHDGKEDNSEEEETLNSMKNKPKKAKNAHTKRNFKNRSKESKMSYNEKVRCMQGRLCFKCKEPGHRIRDCPQWTKGKGHAQ
jgi:hypothetical protein